MKVKRQREEEFVDAKIVTIKINDDVYRLQQSIDGRLIVNKVDLSGKNDLMSVHPSSGNEIQIS